MKEVREEDRKSRGWTETQKQTHIYRGQNTATFSILSTRNVPGIFGTVQTVFAVVEQQPLVSLLGSVPAHPADDVIVQDVEAGGEDGGPDEEVDGAGPQVRLAGPEAPEADGGQ